MGSVVQQQNATSNDRRCAGASPAGSAIDVAGIVLDALLEGRVREARAVAAQHPRVHLDGPPRGYLVTLTSDGHPGMILAHGLYLQPFGTTVVMIGEDVGRASLLKFYDEGGQCLLRLNVVRGFDVHPDLDYSLTIPSLPTIVP